MLFPTPSTVLVYVPPPLKKSATALYFTIPGLSNVVVFATFAPSLDHLNDILVG